MKRTINKNDKYTYAECRKALEINFRRDILLKGDCIFNSLNTIKTLVPLAIVFIFLSLDIMDRHLFYYIVSIFSITFLAVLIGALLFIEINYIFIYRKYYKDAERTITFGRDIVSIITYEKTVHSSTWENIAAVFFIEDFMIISFKNSKMPELIRVTSEETLSIVEFITRIDREHVVKYLDKEKGKIYVRGSLKNRNNKKLYIMCMVLLVLIGSVIYVELNIADETIIGTTQSNSIYDFNLSYEIYENKIIYLASTSYDSIPNKLLIKSVITQSVKDSGITNVDAFKLGGNSIYAQCNKQEFYILDLESDGIKNINLNTYDGFNIEGNISIELMFANYKGAYVTIDDGEHIYILCITPTGKVYEACMLNDMPGRIDRITAHDKYIIFGYKDDTSKTGTYIYDCDSDKFEKLSDMLGEENKEQFAPFIWDNYYVIPLDSRLYFISIDSKERRKIDLIYYSRNLYLEGDWLYDGCGPIVKYNLRTGEVKTYKDYDRCLGTLKIVDGKMYDGYVTLNKHGYHVTTINAKKLKSYKWEDNSLTIF